MTPETCVGASRLRMAPAWLSFLILMLALPPLMAQDRPARGGATVEPAALEPFLPTPDGWTKVRSGSGHVPLSDTTGFCFAEAVFTRDAMNVRVTVADSAKGEDSLIALAAMVMFLPEDHVEQIPPATTVRRLTVQGFQAAERWDAEKHEGEFTVLLEGRFVAKAEGKSLDAPETLRAIVEQINLRKLAALK